MLQGGQRWPPFFVFTRLEIVTAIVRFLVFSLEKNGG
jgi:hypothetical protein